MISFLIQVGENQGGPWGPWGHPGLGPHIGLIDILINFNIFCFLVKASYIGYID